MHKNQENQNIKENFLKENSDLETEEDDLISAVFENKSSILTMLLLFAIMIIFVLFIFFKINS